MTGREVTISIRVEGKDGEAAVNRLKARFAELADVSDAALKL